MTRLMSLVGLVMVAAIAMAPAATAAEIRGEYLETRTCDVYTGPCFANAEVGLTGREAIMAWHIEQGSHNGVALDGLKVVMAVKASDTLGFGGGLVVNPDPIRSVVIVDETADDQQREALVAFAVAQAGRAAGDVTSVTAAPIELQLDHINMVGELTAGDSVHVLTRKLGGSDCVCTNEIVFYPPLAKLLDYAPAYAVESRFAGRGLGAHWSHPQTRSAFLGTFMQ